jgi:putative ABC transport system permease protein
LLVRSFFAMLNLPLGFDSANVLTLRVPIAADRFQDAGRLNAYVRAMVDRVRAVPGVRGAAATDALPLEGFNNGMPFQIAGRAAIDRARRPACGFKMVGAGYFRVLGIQLVQGRTFTDRDVQGGVPVAVINQSMVKRFFAGQDPVGQRVLVQAIVPGKPQLGEDIPWEIVGVIADERTGGLEGTTRAGLYVPIEQSPSTSISMVVRADLEPEALSRSIGAAIHQIDRDQAITDVRTLEQIKTASAASNRLRTTLVAAFATLALVLAAVGIYGVISYTVAQRAHELGVRAALGASTGVLLRMVLAGGMALTLTGLAAGVAGALALTRLLATLLIGVSPRDPVTMAGAAALLAAVALVACYVPARRASTMDPLVTLRDA